MHRLIIRQKPEATGWWFSVERVRTDGVKSAPAVELVDPLALMVGDSDLRLGPELAWYLERYLDYPFGPSQQRAERAVKELRGWGLKAFEDLFGEGQARDFYRDATRDGHDALQLVIASDNAAILAWPWEALHDPLVGDLAHHCRVERQLEKINDPPPLHNSLSHERIGILLVTARPYEDDVAYRSISRPLVDLIRERRLPAEVKLLRPPTLDELRAELQAKPGAYHIVHFDGHGGFGSSTGTGDRFKGPQGHLVFEKEDGSEDLVSGTQLSQLLREYRIPIAVLNACQSAMLCTDAEDAFASVATSLLKAGVRSVLAMGYSLYVTAAIEFLPAFYERLFRSGSMAEATRAGRQALLARPERRPGFTLEDWLVPILYQQDPLSLEFVEQAKPTAPFGSAVIPDAAMFDRGEAPHGLIGRDNAVLALERASRRMPAGLLVHGLGGVGKTTLARGYIEWLAQTQGLSLEPIWLSFTDIRYADYVLNRMVELVLGINAVAAPDEEKWHALREALRDNPFLIVWDNFESASGAADAGLENAMPPADRQKLKQWLEQLHGGKTKVIITSRSDESWLGPTACFRLPLGGLRGEERQALARAILADQGIRFDPRDRDTADLIENLEGHPLMMRAVLPRLGTQSAAALKQAIDRFGPEAQSEDPVERKLYGTLRYVETGLPQALRPLLFPIALHVGHVDARLVAAMAQVAGQPFGARETEQTLELLEMAGLVQGMEKNLFRLHPALTRYLRTRAHTFLDGPQLAQAWERGFLDVFARLADSYAQRPLHEQRSIFAIFGGCIEQALVLAGGDDGSFENFGALTQALAIYGQNRHNLALAQRYYEALAKNAEVHGRESFAAGAYHQLGMVALGRHDFAAAENWYLKALEINERLGNERDAAKGYHQLGRVAGGRHEWATAEKWYRKSLEIKERLGDEEGIATSYHQLGIVAHRRRDFVAAEAWYRKAIEIEERASDESNAAVSYHQCGMLAHDRGDFSAAEEWYRKALEIKERLGDEKGAAHSYHQLGLVAHDLGDFSAAEDWYRKSLEIEERFGDEYGAAITYHQLGIVSLLHHDLSGAKEWYRKSLEIRDRIGDEEGVSSTYHQMGLLAEMLGDIVAAEDWFRKSLEISERLGLPHAEITRRLLLALTEAQSRNEE